MKSYLIQNGGIDPEIVIADNSGINTKETSNFILKYLTAKNLNSVICISQYSHLLRAVLSLKLIGIKDVGFYAYLLGIR